MRRPWTCLWAVLFSTGAAVAGAQEPAPLVSDSPPPPHLSYIEGTVTVDREGVSESAVVNTPLLGGDRLRTDGGRVEVLFADGSALHLDSGTTVDLLAPDLLRLTAGRIILAVAGARDPANAVRYQIDAPPASVQTDFPGEYRLDIYAGAAGDELSLAVTSGSATIATDGGAVSVRAGERARGSAGMRPIGPEYYNSARWDGFDRWSMARRDERRSVVSAQYLPQDLYPYAATFDRYGTWRQDPDDGYVWYPTVSLDWRPYWVGYWRPYPAWDAFWISSDPWGWPTHHYGRWGFSLSFGWYWVPGVSWSSAWVQWAIAPSYVSWCPLGSYNRPVFGLWGVRGHAYTRPVDPWRGWTVVPRQHFGRAVAVTRVAVDGHHLDRDANATFIAQRAAPVNRQAVPRARGVATQPGSNARGSAPSAIPRRTMPTGPAGSRGVADARRPDPAATQRFPAGRGTSAGPSAAPRRAVPGASSSFGTRGGEPSRQNPGSFGAGTAPPGTSPGAGSRRQVFPGPFRPGGATGPATGATRARPTPSTSAPQPSRSGPAPAVPRTDGTSVRGRAGSSGLPSSGPGPSWGTPPRRDGSAVPGYGAAPRPSGRGVTAPSRPAPSSGIRSAPSPRSAPAPSRSPGGMASPSRSAPPGAASPAGRGAPAPPSRYNSRAAPSRGSASPKGGSSRRPPGREK